MKPIQSGSEVHTLAVEHRSYHQLWKISDVFRVYTSHHSLLPVDASKAVSCALTFGLAEIAFKMRQTRMDQALLMILKSSRKALVFLLVLGGLD
jgi:hypothetical protein